MTEPVALELFIGDLGDQFKTQRHPFGVARTAPAILAAGGGFGASRRDPRVGLCIRAVKLVAGELVCQLCPRIGFERRSDADVDQVAVVVVKAKKQRTNPVAVFVPTKAANDHVSGA